MFFEESFPGTLHLHHKVEWRDDLTQVMEERDRRRKDQGEEWRKSYGGKNVTEKDIKRRWSDAGEWTRQRRRV